MSWRLVVICTVVLTVVFSFQTWLVTSARVPTLGIAFRRQSVIWGTWLLLVPLVLAVARRYPIVDAPRRRWLARQFMLATMFSLLHALVVSVVRHSLGIALVDSLMVSVVNLFISGLGRNYLTYGVIAASYHMVAYNRAMRARDVHAMRLEVDLAEARLAVLETRLRPHFLFNTLNTITALVREDPTAAEQMIGQLSDLLRASLRNEPGGEVRLEQELQITQQYLAIQCVRFQGRLHVMFDASADARLAQVPNFLLQPIVENAVIHGIAPRESGGSIWIRAARLGDCVEIVVEDDGVGLPEVQPVHAGRGVGLGSVRSRLAHLYGEAHAIEMTSRDGDGTCVRIMIPYHQSPDAG